jgi:hypothetical protein
MLLISKPSGKEKAERNCMHKIVVWALFDDGERSVSQALIGYKDLRVISIGITPEMGKDTNSFFCDLSKQDCCKQLKQLPKPDIILASPPCES